MGYTHYWYRTKTFNKDAFVAFKNDMVKVADMLSCCGIRLAGWNGKGDPVFTDDDVRFNGLEHPTQSDIDLLNKSGLNVWSESIKGGD
jgi:hypothetical protein